MMDIVFVALMSGVAFIAGWNLSYIRYKEKLINYITNNIPKEPEVTTVLINIEKRNNQLFAWRKDNELFLGQYNSIEELEENVVARIAATESGVVRVQVCDGYEYIEKYLASKATK